MYFDEIKAVVLEQTGCDEAKVTREAKFVDDIGMDSLDLYQVIMNLEEKFDIEIPSEDAEKIKTVSDAVEYVKAKKG